MNLIIVSYDVAHPRRLRRVARLLEGYGERVQESVFECWLTAGKLAELQRALGREIKAEKDRVRYYTLCAGDSRDMHILGCAPTTQDRPWVAL